MDNQQQQAITKVKTIAVISAVFVIIGTAVGSYSQFSLLSKLHEVVQEWSDDSNDDDTKSNGVFIGDVMKQQMLTAIPGMLINLCIALAIPFCGWYGAKTSNKSTLVMFFGCSFCCACLGCFNVGTMSVFFAVAKPYADKGVLSLKDCDAWVTCEAPTDLQERDPAMIDCLAKGKWPEYQRMNKPRGTPPPSQCSWANAMDLNCTGQVTGGNEFMPLALRRLQAADHIHGEATDPWMQLWDNPSQVFYSSNWAWKLAVNTNMQRRLSMNNLNQLSQPHQSEQPMAPPFLASANPAPMLRDPSEPDPWNVPAGPLPKDPLKECFVEVDRIKLVHDLTQAAAVIWPQYQILLIIQLVLMFIAGSINCAGGFFGKQLHDMIQVQPMMPMMAPGMATAYPQPQAAAEMAPTSAFSTQNQS